MSWLSGFFSDITGSTITETLGGAVGSIPVVGSVLEDVGVGTLSNVGGFAGDWFDDSIGNVFSGGSEGSIIPVANGASGTVYSDTGAVISTGGAVAGAMGAVATLGAYLARRFGGAGATVVLNGLRARLDQLWPLVRRYGAVPVAAALGIGADQLAQLLMRAPTTKKRRRRGISYANIRTTRRVVRFTSQMARDIGCVSTPRSFPRAHRHRVTNLR